MKTSRQRRYQRNHRKEWFKSFNSTQQQAIQEYYIKRHNDELIEDNGVVEYLKELGLYDDGIPELKYC